MVKLEVNRSLFVFSRKEELLVFSKTEHILMMSADFHIFCYDFSRNWVVIMTDMTP